MVTFCIDTCIAYSHISYLNHLWLYTLVFICTTILFSLTPKLSSRDSDEGLPIVRIGSRMVVQCLPLSRPAQWSQRTGRRRQEGGEEEVQGVFIIPNGAICCAASREKTHNSFVHRHENSPNTGHNK